MSVTHAAIRKWNDKGRHALVGYPRSYCLAVVPYLAWWYFPSREELHHSHNRFIVSNAFRAPSCILPSDLIKNHSSIVQSSL